jgi:hypothetical protein
MHPEIEKFWTHSGYYVETDVMLPCCDDPFILFWFLMKDNQQLWCVGKSDSFDRNSEAYKQMKENPLCTVYYFYEEQYTEPEMLRIIKLKAFL